MTPRCRIHRPTKSTMQSGRAGGRDWVLEYEPVTPGRPEPLMGWVASGDTLNQVRLRFSSVADAIAFAEKKGMAYDVVEEHKRRIPPKNYGDNFRPRPHLLPMVPPP